jgi:hypothetical protein
MKTGDMEMMRSHTVFAVVWDVKSRGCPGLPQPQDIPFVSNWFSERFSTAELEVNRSLGNLAKGFGFFEARECVADSFTQNCQPDSDWKKMPCVSLVMVAPPWDLSQLSLSGWMLVVILVNVFLVSRSCVILSSRNWRRQWAGNL